MTRLTTANSVKYIFVLRKCSVLGGYQTFCCTTNAAVYTT